MSCGERRPLWAASYKTGPDQQGATEIIPASTAPAERSRGIFAESIVLLVLILSVTIIFTKGMWREGLKSEVSRVLEESGDGLWRVGDFIDFDSSLS